MDRILELLARTSELNAAELAELNTLIAAETERLAAEDSPESTAALLELADQVDEHRPGMAERQDALTAEAEEQSQRRAEALARLRPVEDTDAPAEDDPAGDEADDGDDQDAPADAEPQAEPVAASGQRRQAARATPRPSVGQMATQRRQAGSDRPGPDAQTDPRRALVTVAADVRGFTAGQEISTPAELGRAFAARLSGLGRSVQGVDEPVLVASAQYQYPEDRQLGPNLSENMRKIEAAATPEALTAAGGLCAPYETLYDIPVLGSNARPVRDSLPGFQASRGGIEWRQRPTWDHMFDGIDTWTMADDAAADTDVNVRKPVATVVCPGTETAEVHAVTQRVEFSNVTGRFDPEMVAANTQLGAIAYARFSENDILAGIDAHLTDLTSPHVLGGTRDMLVAVDKLVAAYRSKHRLEDSTPFASILPRWFRDALRADLTRGMAGELEALAVADAQIMGWFAQRNVSVTWTLDGRETAQAAGVDPDTTPAIAAQVYGAGVFADNAEVPAFPSTLEARIYPQGTFLLLDGGTLDLGLVRDSELNSRNRYQTFYEEFLAVVNRSGNEAFRLVAEIIPSGGVASTVDHATITS